MCRRSVAPYRMDRRDPPPELAGVRDAPEIAAMSRDLIETGLGWEYQSGRIARMIADADTMAIVRRSERGIAGFAIMTFGDERAHLVLLAVRVSHQRRGIARRMLARLEESARTAGIASMHVELRIDNAPAHALYRAAGYVETLRIPGYYRGRATAVRMMRLLYAPGLVVSAWIPPAFDAR